MWSSFGEWRAKVHNLYQIIYKIENWFSKAYIQNFWTFSCCILSLSFHFITTELLVLSLAILGRDSLHLLLLLPFCPYLLLVGNFLFYNQFYIVLVYLYYISVFQSCFLHFYHSEKLYELWKNDVLICYIFLYVFQFLNSFIVWLSHNLLHFFKFLTALLLTFPLYVITWFSFW